MAKKKLSKKVVNYLVYVVAAIITIVVFYLLFSPSDDVGTDKGRDALNKSLPEGEAEELPTDKGDAYEGLEADRRDEQRRLELGEDEWFDVNLSGKDSSSDDDEAVVMGRKNKEDSIANAMQENIRATIAAQEEARRKAIEEQGNASVEEANRRRAESAERAKQNQATQDRLKQQQQAMLDAIKGMRGGNGRDSFSADNRDNNYSRERTMSAVMAIPAGSAGVVATTLGEQQRRSGFYGVNSTPVQRNTIKACAYGTQMVSEGQNLKIRLLEPMLVAGNQVIPANSVLVGVCRIGLDRLYVTIVSIEFDGVINAISLNVYDADGLEGLFVPGSLELEAGREIGSDIATSVGASTSQQIASQYNTQSALEQVKADVSRGTISGVFKYVGRRMQVIKVTVQDKHQVFLMTPKN
jgi:conjugative transposon TraM protein